MVLDADQRTIEFEGELRREVFRVKVVGDEVGDHAVQRRQMIDGLEKRRVGGHVFEVADVMAGNHLTALGHGHRVLQLGPDGKDRGVGRIEREGERLRSVTTRPAQHLHSSGHCPGHGVVAADVDRPIVAEQPVGQRTQPGNRVDVVVGNRLVAEVAAGHHERATHPIEQKVVQWAVRQHHPQLRQAGCDRVDDR